MTRILGERGKRTCVENDVQCLMCACAGSIDILYEHEHERRIYMYRRILGMA